MGVAWGLGLQMATANETKTQNEHRLSWTGFTLVLRKLLNCWKLNILFWQRGDNLFALSIFFANSVKDQWWLGGKQLVQRWDNCKIAWQYAMAGSEKWEERSGRKSLIFCPTALLFAIVFHFLPHPAIVHHPNPHFPCRVAPCFNLVATIMSAWNLQYRCPKTLCRHCKIFEL